ncbi:hypothetical protein BD413DRAFT_614095 [Trametes elegans]|nr:hypothetical protein BD413DRAFT_614095 [Trametes elegans]
MPAFPSPSLVVSNIIVRFIWVIYIPQSGVDFIIKTFITGMLEVLRRWLSVKHSARTAGPVRYCYIGFGLTREYDSDDGPPRETLVQDDPSKRPTIQEAVERLDQPDDTDAFTRSITHAFPYGSLRPYSKVRHII